MPDTITLKSKSTGLIGVYPKSHLGMDDDLVAVDSEGNVCLPCMGVKETPESKAVTPDKNDSKDKK